MESLWQQGCYPKLADSAPDSTVGKAPAAPLRGTMNEKKTLAALTTRGQPKETLARIRPAFRKHLRPHTKDRDRSSRSRSGSFATDS